MLDAQSACTWAPTDPPTDCDTVCAPAAGAPPYSNTAVVPPLYCPYPTANAAAAGLSAEDAEEVATTQDGSTVIGNA